MGKLNILFTFCYPIETGGHFRSALAMARQLNDLGHTIHLAAPAIKDEMLEEFREVNARFHVVPGLNSPPRWLSSPRRWLIPTGFRDILQIVQNHRVDLIHAQDFNSLSASFAAAIIAKLPVVYTKAGGPVSRGFPPENTQCIFYSQELYAGMVEKYSLNPDNITVSPARIDMGLYYPSPVDPAFITKYDLPQSSKKIAMAIRISEGKMGWLDTMLGIVERIIAEERDIKLILCGEGPLLPDLKEKAAKLNSRSKVGPVLILPGPIFETAELTQLYNYADLVIGNGRGILEAMACKKPVIILGENSEGECVDEGNVEEIAFYNFAGRHFRFREGDPDELLPSICRLLQDDECSKQAAEFSFDFISRVMDARVGAKLLSEIYLKAIGRKASLLDYLRWTIRYYRTEAKVAFMYLLGLH